MAKIISQDLYDDEYFTHSGGAQAFFQGEVAPIYYQAASKVNLKDEDDITILDIGCGRGDLIRILAPRFPKAKIIGIDYSDAAINIAKQNLANYSNVSILRSDTASFPLENNSVDYVFCLDVVEHLYPQHLDETIKSVYRVLKTGGTLIIHTFPTRCINNTAHFMLKLFNKDSSGQHLHVNTQTYSSMRNLLRDNSFRNITINLEARGNLLQDNISTSSCLFKRIFILTDKLYSCSTAILKNSVLKRFMFSDIWAYAEK